MTYVCLFYPEREQHLFRDVDKRKQLLTDTANVVTFDDLIGIAPIIDQLKATILYMQKELKCDVMIIFAGPPGTGKTTFAEAFAQEIGWDFMMKGATEFRKGIIGSGGEAVRTFFAQAGSEPGEIVIFIDEIDMLGGRQSGGSAETTATLAQIWQSADTYVKGNNGCIIFATNSPDSIDAALRSRARIIEVNPIDEQGRVTLFERLIKKRNDLSDELLNDAKFFKRLAHETENFSGREIKKLINDAVIYKYAQNDNTLKPSHFFNDNVLGTIKQSVAKNMKLWESTQNAD